MLVWGVVVNESGLWLWCAGEAAVHDEGGAEEVRVRQVTHGVQVEAGTISWGVEGLAMIWDITGSHDVFWKGVIVVLVMVLNVRLEQDDEEEEPEAEESDKSKSEINDDDEEEEEVRPLACSGLLLEGVGIVD
jgi:hypothetical protein